MRTVSKRIVSCFMLLIFMASLGTHIFNTPWLTHEFRFVHDSDTPGQLSIQDQASQGWDLKDPRFSARGLSKAEHKLLHATDPAQPLLLTFNSPAMYALLPRTRPFLASLTAPPSADPELPFRPPQHVSRA